MWRVDVEVSRDPLTGRRRRVSRTVRGTRADAEVAASRLKVANHERRLVTGRTSARTVGAALVEYLDAIDAGAVELAPRTIVTTRSAVRTMTVMELPVGRAFGTIPLSRLTWRDVEALYLAMRDSGRGVEWIRRCATVLTQALEFGRKRGLLESNPAKDAKRPRTTRTKPFAPTAHQVQELIAIAEERDSEMADALRLLAATGMRRGELFALLWRDVDLERGEVHVAAAMVDAGKGVGFIREPTKTSDWRDVPLTNGAIAAFRRVRGRRQIAGLDLADGRYVFASVGEPSKPIRPDRITKMLRAVGGPDGITLQDLRHFAATAMLDAGESYRTVADILGNSETTLRLHYDGRTDVGKRRAISALEL